MTNSTTSKTRPAHRSSEFPASVTCDIRGATPIEQLAFDLAREMRRRWRSGERPAADEYFTHHPELRVHPEAAVELIYEEYCLRQSSGDESAEKDLLARFPQWAGPLRVMLDCHRRLLDSERDRPQLPSVGECVGDFRLLVELARGSRGRVFLATQTALADRPVVLKITPLDGAEHLSLARLQHTNIVPLFSAIDDPARDIRILCMPYFGRATLASVLKSLNDVPVDARTGADLVASIDELQETSSAPTESAARQMLANVSYIQAMCWITACLADALQFAHERGVVHLDLKPSNVLLASDGQPMLLDFHLAREPVRPGCSLPEHFGGTPPYMPPEQHDALRALKEGRAVNATVDRRADVYALGAMLYESLGGRLPIATDAPLAGLNPQISRGLSDIIAKCVASRPEDRYTDALSLGEDLRRHLSDQPLVGVVNRSWAERWAKWRRRRPATLRTAAMLGVVIAAAIILLASGWSHLMDRHEQAEAALRDGERQLRDQNGAEAAKTFTRGIALLDGLPFEQEVRSELREQLAVAQRIDLTRQLHELADQIRVLYPTDSIAAGRLAALASQCRQLWQRRETIVRLLGSAPDLELRADLQDIAIFTAGVRAKTSNGRVETEADRHRESLRILNEASELFGPSAVIELERHIQLVALGSPDASPNSTTAPAPRIAWERYAMGRTLLASGDLPGAMRSLKSALQLEPAGVWPNFYYGLCAYRTDDYQDAVAAFSVCIGTMPNVADFFYNRALAFAALGQTDQAMTDYDRALQIDPAHACAALNRGMLYFQQKKLDRAEVDLHLALRHGADAASIYYDLALVHLAANDRSAALKDLSQSLERNPNHEAARQLYASLLQQKTP